MAESSETIEDNLQTATGSAGIDMYAQRPDMTFMCTACAHTFTSKKTLKAHEKKHSGPAPHSCCNKQYWDKTKFTRHRCNHHGEPKSQECPTCGRHFGIQSDLNKHIREVHMERHHVCFHCLMSFETNRRLQEHLAAHEGKRNYICSCGKSYVYSSGLYRHRKQCRK